MKSEKYKVLLADDDEDDCMFFKEVLAELSLTVSLTTVSNGVELMDFLESNSRHIPNLLFLDLNMPLKTGLECLFEIKENKKLSEMVIIIYSTSSNMEIMNLLYDLGARYYIRKPSDYSNLKSVIRKALELSMQQNEVQPLREDFLIRP